MQTKSKQVEDIYPLTPVQHGMLFHTLMEPGSGVYMEQMQCTLGRELDVALFQQALQALVQRHAVLRTSLAWEKVKSPVQVVHRSLAVPFQMLDWRDDLTEQRGARMAAFLEEDLRRGFDLAKAPLLRFALIRVDDSSWEFIWTSHHILYDGWSLAQMMQDLLTIYAALKESGRPVLPAVRPYRDFVAWLKQQDTTSAEHWWREALAGLEAPTPLSLDGRYPGQHGCGERTVRLDKAATGALSAWARERGITMNTIVQGAWAIMLSRYSRQSDVVFGVTVSGRPPELTGVEHMVGLFINTLPLRVQIADVPCAAWLQTLQAQNMEMRQFEFVPLTQIQGWSSIPNGVAMFDSMVVFENFPVDASLRQGASILPVDAIRGAEHTSYALTLVATQAETLDVKLVFDRRRFTDVTIAQISQQLGCLLRSMAEAPDANISALSWTTAEERQRMLVSWNDNALPDVEPQLAHRLFEQWAASSPQQAAIIFDGTSISYDDLNARAERMAGHLRATGVGPDVLVGICAERTPDMVVAILAVFKAGGGYLPLDPAYPAERLAFMLEDAEPAVVLVHRALATTLPLTATPLLTIEDTLATDATQPGTGKPTHVSPANLAYVIYTSGSTGKPKGVLLHHEGLCDVLRAQAPLLGVEPGRRVLQAASFNFDASVWEVFAALATGGTLCMAPREQLLPGRLEHTLTALRPDLAFLTPAVAAALPADLPALPATLLIGGDTCPAALTAQWAAGRRFINVYGPTETTVYAVMHLCAPHSHRSPPIGKPMPNTQCYILDEALNPVPVGVTGELHIGGPGLARGYLHRPGLTAERFIPNPFGPPNSRLYKSGDLARYLPDGAIEHRGRSDGQIKLRGQRIELGEIEAVLATIDGVTEALVMLREDEPGERRLVAYVGGKLAPDAIALRTALHQTLPDHMVPAYFVLLEALPLNHNGKVDRRALPAPQAGDAAGYTPPATATEEILAAIWAGLLKQDKVGAHDNFFALGGHSLLATQAVSQIRAAFKVDLPLRVLFDAPTLRRFAAAVDGLQKTALPAIAPVPRAGQVPLSFAQQRLWFLEQYEPGGATYNIPAALRLQGKLDAEALTHSLQTVMHRHEVLRTRFVASEGKPLQIIEATLELPLRHADLSGLSPTEREACMLQQAHDEASMPFALDAGPLLRTALLRMGEEEHVLLLTLHHIIADGWSIGVLIREVASLYTSSCEGAATTLAPLPVQYADFAMWQQQWLSGAELDRQLDYWRTQLADAPLALALPTSYPRPAVLSSQGAQFSFTLPAEPARQLARKTHTTLFMVLAAAYKALLTRYSGQSDICIGTPVANRNRLETEGLIGFFVNTLVLRSRVAFNGTFNALLQQVRATALGAYAHQDLPFEQLVEALQPERQPGHTPLFQTMLTLQSATSTTLELPGLSVSSVDADNATAKFDLSLNVDESDAGLRATFEYRTSLFDITAIEAMARHFTNLLKAACADPAQRICDLRMLADDEMHRMLASWNDNALPHVEPQLAHRLFEQWVASSPQQAAIIFDGTSISYDDLNARAERMAGHLRAAGVGPDVLVGICAERTPDMVVAILAVFKAGGGYLPLDPAYPAERLAFMLKDAEPAVVLAHRALAATLPVTATPLLMIEDTLATDATQPGTGKPTHVSPVNLAYVIYTSGSTGKPKGVLLHHEGLCDVLRAQAPLLGAEPGRRVLQAASFNFDASVWEVFAALATGGTLCMAPREQLLPGRLEHTLTALRPDLAFLTPAVAAALPADLPALPATLLIGGDTCPAALTAQWAAGRRFINVYGPTETTVYAVMHLCAPDSHRLPPIGKPMPNTQCYILDEALNPVPVGVTGELHIGGPGLARGYLHRPGLTAERFIPNPFGPANSRLYKSGDLARYLPDGAIEHRGRSDGQIKLRGQRIELGEIEAVLAAIDGVTEALVMLREDEPGERRLVAYVGGKLAPDAIALRTALHQTLPDHMVPAHFVLLEALPLNHNGKVDRRALPAPQAGDAAGYTPPATATEEILAAIWAGLLKQDKVGAHDNFFALGGHSLLVTQLVSKIRTAFGIELPVRAPFEASTLATLARRIDAEHGHDLLPAILATPRDDTLPLSFAQQRLWFLDQYEPGAAVYNMPAALRLRGNLDATSLQNALNEIVQRHECLRTHYVQQEGMPQQVIVSRLSLALPVTDLRDLPHGEREARAEWLIEAEAQAPFDLSAGPVIRTSLLRLADDEHFLLCTMHHIVSDGWSSGIFVRELAALYTAFSQGAPSPLAALAIQYAHFAAWQRRWLSGEVLQRQLGFWRQRLQGAPALLALPTDRPRPPVQSYRGASYDFSIPASHVAPLAALTRGEGATLFMGLAAAFNVLLSRYSGQDDICVGTPIANRKHAELENLIGFFANTLVLRTQIERGASFRTLLQQVKGNLLDAYAHQDVPFEQVVEAVAPPRSLAYSPLFQTMLILQNAPGDALQLPGLTLEQMDAEVGTSKFDFRLSLWEEQDGSLHGSFEYNTDLFERSTMARMGSHFAQLLQAAGTQPDNALDALPLLSAEEKTRLLQIWDAIQPGFTSKTDTELALPLPTHHVLDLFEAAALAVPDKTAIEWRSDRVSYRQLDADSNRLAGHLLAGGMHPGAVAAIMLHNPVSQIVATIAILKAGGVFTSLNLRYPVQRVREMLELVRPDWIITDQDSAVQAAQAATGLEWPHRRVLLDGPLDGDDRYVRVAVGPDAPCHIFYTSGSTGKPKPVLGRTSGLAHFIQWEIDTASIGQDVRASQLTNPSFHVYLRDIFPALCCGGTVCVPPSDEVFESAALANWLEASEITLLHCVPSSFRLLLGANLCSARLRELRTVVVGGGALLPPDVNRWNSVYGGTKELIGVYGQTETSLAKFFYRVPPTLVTAGYLPMGRPLPGAQAILLNANLEPCAPGETGELYVRTPYRSLGYYRQPELTQAAFVSNPYSKGEQDVLYKTGDLAMLLADGTFRYMGRRDFQVKVRGMRVETGEVESALGDLRDVAQAVVLAHEAGEGEKSLTGYVIAQPDRADLGLPARIRAQLLDALPDYMVPSHIMVLERFPLTPNGKIDRAAFPRPEAGQGAAPYVAPRTPAEARLCEIWTEILGLVRVGVHDDFFLLGGHSLLATQAVARVNSAFGIRMPVRSLFEAPTIAALALCIEQAARDDGAAPVIRPRLQTATAPLSFAQRRLWFLDQLEPGSPLYNLPSALRLSGTLDAAALEQALNQLVVRHAVLRTRFASQDGEPVQLIVPDLALSLPLTDLSALPHGERVARADWHIQEEMRAPFDLAVGPPIRAQLLRLEPQAHVLLLTVHHIATDGWSNNLLARELADCYRAVITGETVKLSALPIQYADYASWQHDHLQGDVLARQLDYWTAQLAGVPAMLELPTDRPRPQTQTHEGAMYRFTLPAARLRVVAGGERATLFMALTAVFSMLLARYSGQDDICIGTPVANRSQAETKNLVGFFANTLVLRTRLDSDTDFSALLRQVRTTALDAFAHQELPFEKLVEALQPERSMDRSPLFQAMLVLQNTPGAVFALPGLEWQAIDSDSRTAKFDITLAVAGDGDVLEAGLEYNTALFDHDTIARMAGHLLRLIDAACADPALPLAELSMLAPEERQQILYGFNPGHSSPAGTVQTMFEAAAGRTPDAIAIEYEDQILSYAELDARTNRLARELLAMGVRTDARVGVCLERSPAMVIALLAVLKTGAAYVPLDPGYPRDRLSAMLEDAAPTLVLTQTSLIDRLPAISSVSMEALEQRAEEQAADSLNLHIPPDSLAYVLFTSGSTGRPKGVAMPSAALANLLAWQLEQRRSKESMRVFQFASLNFDVSFQEIFSALCAGDTLVLCSEARRADLDGLRSYIAERRCGRVFLPNAVLQHFAGGPDMAPWPEPCDIVTAGEQLAITDALTKLVRTTGAAMVYNQYGPTETHVATQSSLEVKRIADWPALPPIGRPIAGMCCHILDRALNPVPVGVVGELYIAGAGLARGYIGRPALSAERFLPNPYGAPGTRMYRSGDLARYREDGEIEFLGRADQQVKLRGFRIELGEVEAALSTCAPGCEVVAVVREDQPGDRRLVAYVAGTNPPDADELRPALRSLLPDYMLPSHIVPLASLPLTPNGKVDRRALPLPEVRVGEGRYEAPEGPLEEALAGIWCAVLNAGQVGRYDNFFSLGGHSLLAMRLIARIREEFDVDLPPRTLFDGPTVAAQAEAVEALILQKIEGMTDEQARSIANDLSE